MTDLQGVVGIVQLSKLDRFIEERQEWANYYNQALTGIPWLHTPVLPMGYKHGWQAYVMISNNILTNTIYIGNE